MKCSFILLLCVICWQLSPIRCEQKIKSVARLKAAGYMSLPSGAHGNNHHDHHHKDARTSDRAHHRRKSKASVWPNDGSRRSMRRKKVMVRRSLSQDAAPSSAETNTTGAERLLIQIFDTVWSEVHETLPQYLATVNHSMKSSNEAYIVIGLSSIDDTVPPVRKRRMIGSRYATLEEYPYVVSILKNKEHWCSGSLVSHRVAVTSANCFLKPDASMEVRVGTRNSMFGGHLVPIMSVVSHPKWTRMKEPSPDYDVALLILNKTINNFHNDQTTAGRHSVRHGQAMGSCCRVTGELENICKDGLHAVELPPKSLMPAFNDVWVTSFGTRNPNGKYGKLDGNLEVYRTNLTDMEECKNITKLYRARVSRNHICLSQAHHLAPCTRDTGAPAVSDGYLWGIASWGVRKTCGAVRQPAMFSYLGAPSHGDFLKTSLEEINEIFPHTEP